MQCLGIELPDNKPHRDRFHRRDKAWPMVSRRHCQVGMPRPALRGSDRLHAARRGPNINNGDDRIRPWFSSAANHRERCSRVVFRHRKWLIHLSGQNAGLPRRSSRAICMSHHVRHWPRLLPTAPSAWIPPGAAASDSTLAVAASTTQPISAAAIAISAPAVASPPSTSVAAIARGTQRLSQRWQLPCRRRAALLHDRDCECFRSLFANQNRRSHERKHTEPRCSESCARRDRFWRRIGLTSASRASIASRGCAAGS